MKRFFAVILTIALLLSFTSVLAADDTAERFEQAMLTQYSSAAIKINIDFGVSGSLFESDEGLMQIKELFDGMSIIYDINVKGNDELSKIEGSGNISLESEALSRYIAYIEEDMLEEAEEYVPKPVDMGMWFNMDLTDEKNPIYYVITENLVGDRYFVVDLDMDMLLNMFKMGAFAPENAESINKKMYDGIKTSVKFENGTYTVKMTEAELKKAVGKWLSNLVDVLPELGIPAEEADEMKEEILPYILTLADVQLFDKDEAFVFTCDVDENNLCTGMSFKLNIDTNAYDIANLFVPEEMENQNRDEWGVSVVLSADVAYEELPDGFAVEYPVLSPENCDGFKTYALYDERDYETPITVNCNDKEIAFDEPPMLLRNRTMVPVRALANAIGIEDENISYEEGTEKIVLKNGDSEIVMYVDSQYAYLNGELKVFDAPAVENNGRAYIPARAISEFFGKSVDYTDLAESGGFGLVVDISD